jgi:hypothetical protein
MKGMGKIDTQTLLIIGVVGIGAYMLLNKAPTVIPPSPLVTSQLLANQQAAAGNSTAGIIAGGGTAISAILNAISNF